jgi:hypothetical protein
MGFAPDNLVFPTVLNCPFCGETALYAYDDMAREDVWFNCDGCSAYGNIITFAAQIWKIDPAAALDRFVAEKLCARNIGAEDYVTNSVKQALRLQRANELWAEAENQLWSVGSEAIGHKLRDFGISRDIPCTGLVGAAEEVQLAAVYSSVSRAYPRHMRDGEPVLVFPYYDLPGRLSGFLLAKYSLEFDAKRTFLPLSPAGCVRPDAGYYLLKTALLPPHPTIKNAHFVVDDPIWALKAQTTQIRHGLPLLPISASYAGLEAASLGATWNSLPNSKRFFYAENITAELISQAAGCRGYVCPAPPEYIVQAAMPARTLKRLAKICKYATTWQSALAEVFNNLNPIAAQAFAARLTIARDKLGQFLKTRTTMAADDASRVLNRIVPRRETASAYSQEHDVIVRDDGWYTARGLPIINCRPVIDKIVYTDTGKKYYAGYVLKNDKRITFFEPAPKIDRGGFLDFVTQLMAEHNELVINSSRYRLRALATALKINPPQIVHVCTTFGWNAKTREFNFGNYTLANDGTIVPLACPELPHTNTFDFPEPGVSAPPAISTILTQSHEDAFLWATTAAVLANMLAPITEANCVSVAVPENNFAAAAQYCVTMGCAAKQIGMAQQTMSALIKELQAAVSPTAISVACGSGKLLERAVVKCPNTAAVVGMLPASIPGALSYGWAAVAPVCPLSEIKNCDPIRFIVPAYVQRVLRQRLGLNTRGSLVVAVLHDIHKWLEMSYGGSFNLAAAQQMILQPETAHIAFMRMLNDAIALEKIDVLPQPRYAGQRPNYLIRNKQHWWLSKKAINKYLLSAGIVPNWSALIDCFTKQGVFCGEYSVHNMPGLLITRDWCDAFWGDYNNNAAKHAG